MTPLRLSSGRLVRGPLKWADRIENYKWETKYPDSLMVAGDGRMVGYWLLGNNYKRKAGYHGEYPATYMKRVKALFPDKRRVLHLFSGAVDLSIIPGDTVDLKLPTAMAYEPRTGTHYVDDAQTMTRVPLEKYDMVMVDPPYTNEDADHYGTTMIKRHVVLRTLAERLRPGTHVVWLDMTCPMWRKDEFDLAACVGIQRSSNHRDRTMRIFVRRRVEDL